MQPFFIWANNRIYSRLYRWPSNQCSEFSGFPVFFNYSNSLHISISNLKLIGFSPNPRKYYIFEQIESECGQNKVSINNIVCDIPICNKYYFYLELLTLSQIFCAKFCANVELIHIFVYYVCDMYFAFPHFRDCGNIYFQVYFHVYFQECRISINICRYLLAYKFSDTIIQISILTFLKTY